MQIECDTLNKFFFLNNLVSFSLFIRSLLIHTMYILTEDDKSERC